MDKELERRLWFLIGDLKRFANEDSETSEDLLQAPSANLFLGKSIGFKLAAKWLEQVIVSYKDQNSPE